MSFIGGRSVRVSSTAANLNDAAAQCSQCLGTSLADINSAGAMEGSPNGAEVCSHILTADVLQYYIGGYEGARATLVFFGNSITERIDLVTPRRFICAAPQAPPTTCTSQPCFMLNF